MEISRDNVIDIRNYLVVSSIIANSAMPLFKTHTWVIVTFLINAFFYVIKKDKKILKNNILALLAITIIIVLQVVYYGGFYLRTAILQLLLFTSAFLCVNIVEAKFYKIFANIIYYTIIPSLFFYSVHILFPHEIKSFALSLPDILSRDAIIYGRRIHETGIVIYHFNPNSFIEPRNNGPFWEAGVYAGMLLIALVIEILGNNKLFSKRSILIMVGVITTYSTTGYLALFFLVISFFLVGKKINVYKIILAVLSIIISISLYQNIPFLKDKIESRTRLTDRAMKYRGGDTRFASAVLDIQGLLSSKTTFCIGLGSHPKTRLGKYVGSIRTNGFTGLFATWGFFFSMAYIILFFMSINSFALTYGNKILSSFAAFFAILLLTISQNYFDMSLFHCFLFLGPFTSCSRDECFHKPLLYGRYI